MIARLNSFTLGYKLISNAEPGYDIQFGMEFTLVDSGKHALCQLIFPATAVGTNKKGQWNIDNHKEGNNPSDLIFPNAEHGSILDTPTELTKFNEDVQSTKFAVYMVNLEKAAIYADGVQFGYTINPNQEKPETTFLNLIPSKLTTEQEELIKKRCSYIKIQ